MDLEKTAGLRRVAWNLRGDLQAVVPGGRGGRGGAAGAAPQAAAPAGGFGGRGSQQAPLAAPGHYRAVLGRMVGDAVTPIGAPQPFSVVPIPQ